MTKYENTVVFLQYYVKYNKTIWLMKIVRFLLFKSFKLLSKIVLAVLSNMVTVCFLKYFLEISDKPIWPYILNVFLEFIYDNYDDAK